uniref:Ribonucloprotein n=1 Tax=Rhabditophanes sp. KR3021 TaxID=114890 RepID=A0AC35TPW9_9BILA
MAPNFNNLNVLQVAGQPNPKMIKTIIKQKENKKVDLKTKIIEIIIAVSSKSIKVPKTKEIKPAKSTAAQKFEGKLDAFLDGKAKTAIPETNFDYNAPYIGYVCKEKDFPYIAKWADKM